MEKIGVGVFFKSGIEQIELPQSVKSIGARAFFRCEHLRHIKLNEGLEKLGEKEI